VYTIDVDNINEYEIINEKYVNAHFLSQLFAFSSKQIRNELFVSFKRSGNLKKEKLVSRFLVLNKNH